MAGSRLSVLAAGLEITTTSVVPGGSVGYAVINTGDLPIMLTEAYELDRRTDEGWERVSLPYAFPLWGRRLQTGNRYGLSARVPELAQPGRYRLRKWVAVDRDPHPGYEWVATREIEPVEVAAEFDVSPD